MLRLNGSLLWITSFSFINNIILKTMEQLRNDLSMKDIFFSFESWMMLVMNVWEI